MVGVNPFLIAYSANDPITFVVDFCSLHSNLGLSSINCLFFCAIFCDILASSAHHHDHSRKNDDGSMCGSTMTNLATTRAILMDGGVAE